MTIGIDGNEANALQHVGVNVYALSLLNYFSKKADKQTRFIIYLKDSPRAFLPSENDFFKYVIVKPEFLWSRFALTAQLYLRRETNVFFAPAHYAPHFCPVPLVVTIHDLSYLYFPQEFLQRDLYKLRAWTKRSIGMASKIIVVSHHTGKDIMKFYHKSSSDIEVIHNGYQHHDPDRTEAPRHRPYILYVGTLQPRKNISMLIKAFSRFKKNHLDYQLRLAGKKGWLYTEIFEVVKTLKLENDVIFEGFVSEQRKSELYTNTTCFVMPSLYEGFGMPILEAMSYSCPVISSDTSSLPEIGADACIYFDPAKEYELLAKLELLADDEKLRNKMIRKGLARVKDFSWEKCAEATLKVIKSAVT